MAKKRTAGLRFQSQVQPQSRGPSLGKRQRLDIQRLAGDGRGVAFVEGRTWFVQGALAGEQVAARVLSSRGKVVEARCEQVLTAAPERLRPRCAHAGDCGGCSLQHMPLVEQRALKQSALTEQLQRVAGVAPQQWMPPLLGEAWGYRRRARLAVNWDARSRQLALGFRALSSQAIVSIEQCPVLVAELEVLLVPLRHCLQGLVKPRVLGHVELFSGNQVALLVRHVGSLAEVDLAQLEQFCAERGIQLWLQGAGSAQCHYPGSGTFLGFTLGPWGLSLACQPGDFVQVNAEINQAMVAQALDWLQPSPGERVWDLFCGLGNFSLPLVQAGSEVIGVEGVTEMVTQAEDNARRHALAQVRFLRADLEQPLPASLTAWAPDAVLLDPPREGAWSLVTQAKQWPARRLLYVSCNPATLARDAAELIRQGFCLQRAGMLDMFPHTSHVETMALFVR